jgi:hypothetical protein
MLVSIPIWVRTITGVIAVAVVATLTAVFAWRGSPRARLVMAQFLALTLALDTVSRSDYLFTSGAMVGGVRRTSDIQRVADALGGSYLAWGALVALIAFALLALGMRIAWWMPDAARRPVTTTGSRRI